MEAKNVAKHVNQSAKEKNENVEDKKKFWKNYIKLLVKIDNNWRIVEWNGMKSILNKGWHFDVFLCASW